MRTAVPTAPAEADAGRYLIVPCEAPAAHDLAVIWDRQEQQVIDVVGAVRDLYDRSL